MDSELILNIWDNLPHQAPTILLVYKQKIPSTFVEGICKHTIQVKIILGMIFSLEIFNT